jgi:hypothetical protein
LAILYGGQCCPDNFETTQCHAAGF